MTPTLLPARRYVLSLLKNDAALTALVPSASIYPQSPPALPAFPFIKYGGPSELAVSAACVSGSDIRVSVHGFSKGRAVAGALVETAEDHASRIGQAIRGALERKRATIDGVSIGIRWLGSVLTEDGEGADAYHTEQQFRIRVLG